MKKPCWAKSPPRTRRGSEGSRVRDISKDNFSPRYYTDDLRFSPLNKDPVLKCFLRRRTDPSGALWRKRPGLEWGVPACPELSDVPAPPILRRWSPELQNLCAILVSRVRCRTRGSFESDDNALTQGCQCPDALAPVRKYHRVLAIIKRSIESQHSTDFQSFLM